MHCSGHLEPAKRCASDRLNCSNDIGMDVHITHMFHVPVPGQEAEVRLVVQPLVKLISTPFWPAALNNLKQTR